MFKKYYLFIYLAVPALSGSTRDLQLWHAGSSSLTRDGAWAPCIGPRAQVPRRLFYFIIIIIFGHAAPHVRSQFPDQGSHLYSLIWKHGVLTTGLPGKSLIQAFRKKSPKSCIGYNATFAFLFYNVGKIRKKIYRNPVCLKFTYQFTLIRVNLD